MSQIFGKGKVSAEELQGQLGERLPGAVVKFANANGIAVKVGTAEKLDFEDKYFDIIVYNIYNTNNFQFSVEEDSLCIY